MALLAVVGAHLSGQPLDHQLSDRGGQLVTTTRTASTYRLFALPTDPPEPGLLRTCEVAGDDAGAGSIEVEVWELDDAAMGEPGARGLVRGRVWAPGSSARLSRP